MLPLPDTNAFTKYGAGNEAALDTTVITVIIAIENNMYITFFMRIHSDYGLSI